MTKSIAILALLAIVGCSSPDRADGPKTAFSGPTIPGSMSPLLAPGGVAFTGVIAPTALNGTQQNNYCPTGIANASIISQDLSADTTMTGVCAYRTGSWLNLHNISASSKWKLTSADGSSSALNQFVFADPQITLYPGDSAWIRDTGSGWRAWVLARGEQGLVASQNAYAGTLYYEWKTDHISSISVNDGLDHGFVGAFTGTGAQFSSVGSTGRLGVTQASTGTTTTGNTRFTTSTFFPSSIAARAEVETVFGVPTLDDGTDKYVIEAGWITAGNTINQTNGCFVAYDHNGTITGSPGTGDVLQCWSASSSATHAFKMDGITVSDESFTTVNVPVAARTWPSTNILHVLVVMTPGVRCEFYVNGVKSCDLATDIPAATLAAGWAITKSAGTNARTMEVDFTRAAVTLTSSRPSP